MNFETEYKNIHFHITIEKEDLATSILLMGDKFNRLPTKTMIEIKNGELVSYNIIIVSTKNNESQTHYLSGILLSSNPEEILHELGSYLDQEEVLDDIVGLWERYQIEPGPFWRIK